MSKKYKCTITEGNKCWNTKRTFMVPVRSDYLEYALNYIKQVLEDEAFDPEDDDIWRELKHSLEDAERKSKEYFADFNMITLEEE